MFLDTSGLFSYLHRKDHRHGDAVTLFDAARRRLTYNYILAELAALAKARKYDRPRMLGFLAALQNHPEVRVIWVDDELHRQALEMVQGQLDKTYSLCDAVSFRIMNLAGISEALRTDRHFEQAGFIRLLK